MPRRRVLEEGVSLDENRLLPPPVDRRPVVGPKDIIEFRKIRSGAIRPAPQPFHVAVAAPRALHQAIVKSADEAGNPRFHASRLPACPVVPEIGLEMGLLEEAEAFLGILGQGKADGLRDVPSAFAGVLENLLEHHERLG